MILLRWMPRFQGKAKAPSGCSSRVSSMSSAGQRDQNGRSQTCYAGEGTVHAQTVKERTAPGKNFGRNWVQGSSLEKENAAQGKDGERRSEGWISGGRRARFQPIRLRLCELVRRPDVSRLRSIGAPPGGGA